MTDVIAQGAREEPAGICCTSTRGGGGDTAVHTLTNKSTRRCVNETEISRANLHRVLKTDNGNVVRMPGLRRPRSDC